MILLVLIALAPGDVWLRSMESSDWFRALEYEDLAGETNVSSAGLVPPPVFFGTFAPSPIETRNGPVNGTAGISQMIPWPGYLGAVRESAVLTDSSSSIQRRIRAFERRTAIAGLWAESYRRAALAEIASEREALLSSLEMSAEASASALLSRSSSLADLRIKSELAALDSDAETALYEAMLNQLEAVAGIPVAELDDPPSADWFERRIFEAETNPPSLNAAELAVEKAEAALQIARADRMPDITAGLSYSFVGEPEVPGGAVEAGKDSWMLSLGLSLPVGYSGFSDRQRSAEYLVLSSASSMEAVQAEVNARLETLEVTIGNLAEEVKLLEEMVPLAETASRSAAAEWISGRGSYSSLLASLQTELDIKKRIIDRNAQLITSTAMWLEIAGAETEEGEFL